MSKPFIVRITFSLLLLLGIVTAAFGGGWAIVTLSEFPDYAVAGKPLNLTFLVRQHGVTLLSGLKPAVRATAPGGKVATGKVVERGGGEYTTALTLPESADWTIAIDSGFNGNVTTLPALKVIAGGADAPAPFTLATRGVRLFAAKGCVGCHRHQEVNPERQTDAKFDLTTRRFDPDYLKKFLADPSIRTADMPILKLKADEIEALAVFIDKTAMKKSLVKDGEGRR
jgi:mono/diheme cytochrome c family protein